MFCGGDIGEMTTKKLLASNSYIQFPKFLGAHIGANEALVLSAFCDIDSWCELNVEKYDGWFYALQSDIHWETGLSEKQQRLAIQHLVDIGLLHVDRRGLPAKNYFLIDSDELENRLDIAYTEYKLHKSQMLQNVTSRGDERLNQDVTKNQFLLLNENKKDKNTKESTGAGALAKHPRNFSRNTLTDDLQSGKDIDEQKKTKKKTSEYDKCLAEIDKRYEDPKLYAVVMNHLDWSYNSKDPNRIKTLKTYIKRLDELDNLSGDKIKIVQQSIDKKWHCFYEVKQQTTKSYSDHSDGIITQRLSQEEAAELLAREAEEYGVI